MKEESEESEENEEGEEGEEAEGREKGVENFDPQSEHELARRGLLAAAVCGFGVDEFLEARHQCMPHGLCICHGPNEQSRVVAEE